MSGKAHKKARKNLKRAKKKKEARRLQTLSPFRRAAQGGQIECYRGSSDEGLATLIVLGHVSGGSYVMSGFLVDLWCVGLKDAWGHKQTTKQYFEQEFLPQWRKAGETIARTDLESARRLLAGAIRFSHQNGFRLPEHWDRYAAILGDLGDVASADLSEFGVGGKLRYVGTQQFLRERLAKCSMSEFLQRPDVEFIFQAANFGDDDEDVDDEDLKDDEDVDGDEDDDDEEAFDPESLLDDPEAVAAVHSFAKQLLPAMQEQMAKRCQELGMTPHPMLAEFAVIALAVSAQLENDESLNEEEIETLWEPMVIERIEARPPDVQHGLREAMEQYMEIAPSEEELDTKLDQLLDEQPPGQ